MFENVIAPTEEEPPLWRHIVVTVIITLLVGGISMSTDCLGIVLELNVSNWSPFVMSGLVHVAPENTCIFEPRNEKTGYLLMVKQRRRPAAQLLHN